MFDLIQIQATYQIRPRGIIHVGAHRGQEADVYDNVFRAGQVLWVEADLNTYSLLRLSLAGRSHHIALQGLVAETDDDVRTFYLTTNDGMSSSYLPLKEHLNIYPSITVKKTTTLSTTTLPTLLARHRINSAAFDYLVIDGQGTELDVLRGCGDSLSSFHWISCEVNRTELYEGCALFDDITSFLQVAGFQLVDSAWTEYGWGEALYLRQPSIPVDGETVA